MVYINERNNVRNPVHPFSKNKHRKKLKVYVTLFISLAEQSLFGSTSTPEHCEVGQSAEDKDGFAQRGRPRQCLLGRTTTVAATGAWYDEWKL